MAPTVVLIGSPGAGKSTRAPGLAAATWAALSPLRAVPLTWWPARTSGVTKAEPMVPAPMTVIFMTGFL